MAKKTPSFVRSGAFGAWDLQLLPGCGVGKDIPCRAADGVGSILGISYLISCLSY